MTPFPLWPRKIPFDVQGLGWPCGPANDAALRPSQQAGHAESGRADFDLTVPGDQFLIHDQVPGVPTFGRGRASPENDRFPDVGNPDGSGARTDGPI